MSKKNIRFIVFGIYVIFFTFILNFLGYDENLMRINIGKLVIMSLELLLSSVIVVVLVILLPTLFLLSKKLGPQESRGKAKNSAYESGVSTPIGNPESRFSAKFYLVAILFVLFDVEIIFMFPWAVNVRELGYFGLFEMFTFVALLFFGLIYIYRIKALKWQ